MERGVAVAEDVPQCKKRSRLNRAPGRSRKAAVWEPAMRRARHSPRRAFLSLASVGAPVGTAGVLPQCKILGG